jgi:hypothetical protein
MQAGYLSIRADPPGGRGVGPNILLADPNGEHTTEVLSCGYPFTAPAVRPATILFWKINTKTTSGTVTVTAAAIISPYGS